MRVQSLVVSLASIAVGTAIGIAAISAHPVAAFADDGSPEAAGAAFADTAATAGAALPGPTINVDGVTRPGYTPNAAPEFPDTSGSPSLESLQAEEIDRLVAQGHYEHEVTQLQLAVYGWDAVASGNIPQGPTWKDGDPGLPPPPAPTSKSYELHHLQQLFDQMGQSTGDK